MSKKYTIGIIVLIVIVVAAALFIILSPSAEEPPILDRNKDPEYIQTLQSQRAEQQKVGSELAKALNELAAAKAEDPNSEKVKELEKKVESARLEVEKNRQVSMAIIRQRMLQEQSDKDKARAVK